VAMMYVRFPLSLRNVEYLLFERGIDICYETVRLWWNRFGSQFAGDIRRQRVQAMLRFRHWKWHLDEKNVTRRAAKPTRFGSSLLSTPICPTIWLRRPIGSTRSAILSAARNASSAATPNRHRHGTGECVSWDQRACQRRVAVRLTAPLLLRRPGAAYPAARGNQAFTYQPAMRNGRSWRAINAAIS
jgi:hypothetical protein